MIGQTISHYKILEKLGEGGMGVVYKAHDTKLNRTVALKSLKPMSLVSEEDRIRFVTEAQAAASLDHPNICTIYAIEEIDGQTFIVMSYIEGESLQGKIQRGPLKVEEVLDISIQIAEGLNQAHQKGIIHRDIKSGNILISALGLVKIMDFGLARLVGRTTITKEGTTLGTPGYMSPEQARGDKLDRRTDIWSLAVVMYEMITGRLPFRGDYQEAVVYSILNEQAEPPTAVRTGVPMDLEKIISKAMAKNANERYQHLDELLVDLRREKKIVEQGESSPKIPSRGKEYRKLSAIMFSDIVSYGKIMQQDEDLAMDLLTRHNQLVREVIRKYDGKEIKVVGDAFLVDFETVVNAVRCAIEIQETVSRYNEDQPENRRILLRIGIHVGDIIVKENDVFGDGVNIASRIEPLAEPGGICISQEVYNLVKHKLDVQVISLGPKELKNIKDKIEIYEILVGSIAGKELSASGSRIVARGKPLYKRPRVLVGAAIVLVGVVFGAYFFLSRTTAPRSQMTTRVLRVPSLEARDANISPDGNWITYVVESGKGFAVYIQAASGSDPRKIAGDSLYKRSPCFSPDATEILYDEDDRRDPTTGRWIYNIYKVSVLGGSPRKIINDGESPMWSPDGKAIAFMRNADDKSSVWLANPDGSAQKQVTEEQGRAWAAYAWSPDSRSIGFSRDFKEGYSQLFVLDLSSGNQRQLTFDKSRKHGLCWAATDEFIFSSGMGTNVNLWTVPVEGGTPKQLTFELGQVLDPRISKDAKRLLYTIIYGAFNLWTTDLETKQSKQLTFEEGIVWEPAISPRGNKLLYRWLHFGVGELIVSNVDGSEPTKIHHPPGWPRAARWSGDGKAVAYSVGVNDTVSVKPDSVRDVNVIFIQDLEKESAQKIGTGILVDWSPDGKHMLFQREGDRSNPSTYVLALTSSLEKPMREIQSSNQPSFTHDSKDVLCTDSTRLWSMSIGSGQRSVICSLPKGDSWAREMPDGKSISLVNRSSADERILTFLKAPKSGKKPEKLFEAAGALGEASYSPDMKTCIFTKADFRNKIVINDNFR